jgi:hypothetical protein
VHRSGIQLGFLVQFTPAMDPVCCLQYFCGVLKTRSKHERVVKINSQEINLIVGPERPPVTPQFNLKVYGMSPPTFSFDAAALSRTRVMTTAEQKGKVLHPWGLQAYDDFVENGTCMFHEAHRGSVDGYLCLNCCLWPQTYNSSVTYEWPVEVPCTWLLSSVSPVHLANRPKQSWCKAAH